MMLFASSLNSSIVLDEQEPEPNAVGKAGGQRGTDGHGDGEIERGDGDAFERGWRAGRGDGELDRSKGNCEGKWEDEAPCVKS